MKRENERRTDKEENGKMDRHYVEDGELFARRFVKTEVKTAADDYEIIDEETGCPFKPKYYVTKRGRAGVFIAGRAKKADGTYEVCDDSTGKKCPFKPKYYVAKHGSERIAIYERKDKKSSTDGVEKDDEFLRKFSETIGGAKQEDELELEDLMERIVNNRDFEDFATEDKKEVKDEKKDSKKDDKKNLKKEESENKYDDEESLKKTYEELKKEYKKVKKAYKKMQEKKEEEEKRNEKWEALVEEEEAEENYYYDY